MHNKTKISWWTHSYKYWTSKIKEIFLNVELTTERRKISGFLQGSRKSWKKMERYLSDFERIMWARKLLPSQIVIQVKGNFKTLSNIIAVPEYSHIEHLLKELLSPIIQPSKGWIKINQNTTKQIKIYHGYNKTTGQLIMISTQSYYWNLIKHLGKLERNGYI